MNTIKEAFETIKNTEAAKEFMYSKRKHKFTKLLMNCGCCFVFALVCKKLDPSLELIVSEGYMSHAMLLKDGVAFDSERSVKYKHGKITRKNRIVFNAETGKYILDRVKYQVVKTEFAKMSLEDFKAYWLAQGNREGIAIAKELVVL